MKTKLTLRLEADLIARAKAHARRTGKPISRVVADYFARLPDPDQTGAGPAPRTRSLRGVLRGSGRA